MSEHRVAALPYLCACLGMMTFCAMDALMKGLSIAIGAYNAMLWRVLAGVLIGAVAFAATRTRWPTKAAMRLHMLRGAVATGMTLAFFWGLARVPLAEGTAITFVAPLIALYLAALLLGEVVSRKIVLASLAGFVGVLIIVAGRLGSPHSDDALHGMCALLFSALLYAYNLILQRQQAQIAAPIEIAFFQNVVVLFLLCIPAPYHRDRSDVDHVPALVASAVLAFVSLLLLSWAYARAEAQVLLTVEYTAFIWAAILGWIFFAERVSISAFIGTALIVAACVFTARFRASTRLRIDTTST